MRWEALSHPAGDNVDKTTSSRISQRPDMQVFRLPTPRTLNRSKTASTLTAFYSRACLMRELWYNDSTDGQNISRSNSVKNKAIGGSCVESLYAGYDRRIEVPSFFNLQSIILLAGQ